MQKKLNIDFLKFVLGMSTRELIQFVKTFLEKNKYEVITDNDNYVFGIPKEKGTSKCPRICLVSHMDTITRSVEPPVLAISNTGIMTNPGSVLGADDRAGVFINLEIIKDLQYKPYVIFTNYEEQHGIGVSKFVKDDHFKDHVENVDFFIEPDRQSTFDFVHYLPLPKQYRDFVESFGFVHANGSYSDVKNLTEEYRIPHINIAVGYKSQHTSNESLNLMSLEFTLRQVRDMFNFKVPRELLTEHQAKPFSSYSANFTGGRHVSNHYIPKQTKKFHGIFHTFEEYEEARYKTKSKYVINFDGLEIDLTEILEEKSILLTDDTYISPLDFVKRHFASV